MVKACGATFYSNGNLRESNQHENNFDGRCDAAPDCGYRICAAVQHHVYFEDTIRGGRRDFPAGTYQIRLLDQDDNLFECASTSSSHSVLFEADMHEEIPSKTDVMFAKYGDKLILKNIDIGRGRRILYYDVTSRETRQKRRVKPTNVSLVATKK